MKISYHQALVMRGMMGFQTHHLSHALIFVRAAGILEDFLFLVNRVGLTTYMEDERDQHVMLTKTFVESFSFYNSHFRPTVSFKIYDRPFTMTLVDFYAAIGIAPSGTARRIQGNPTELLEL